MSASDGRLSPFLPASDTHGVDLVVCHTETAACLGVQVKSWTARPDPVRPTVQFDVRRATFLPTPRVALAALVLDPATMELHASWLIPMDRVPELSTVSEQKFALTPSTSPASSDRYSCFRHGDVTSLVEAIGELLES